jgi:hypothetical protein
LRADCVGVPARESAAGEERVRDGHTSEVVVQAGEGAAFVVIESEALLELAVVVLDSPAQLR